MRTVDKAKERLLRAAAIIGLGLIGLVLAAHAAPPAAQHDPRDVPQLGVIVAYENGEAKAAHAVGFASSLGECQAGLVQYLATIEPKPGVKLAIVCTPLPPAPHGADSDI